MSRLSKLELRSRCFFEFNDRTTITRGCFNASYFSYDLADFFPISISERLFSSICIDLEKLAIICCLLISPPAELLRYTITPRSETLETCIGSL